MTRSRIEGTQHGLPSGAVPVGPDPWMPFAEFALSFDGYAYRSDLGSWANAVPRDFVRDGHLPTHLTLDDLRALAFPRDPTADRRRRQSSRNVATTSSRMLRGLPCG
jgi:hypothetical protein